MSRLLPGGIRKALINFHPNLVFREAMKFFLPQFKTSLPKEKISVGLDIGTASLKIAKLVKEKDNLVLSDFALEPAQPSLEQALKKMSESYKDIFKINISVSGPATLIRYISFPKMTGEELKQALKFEIQKYIPFSINEINLDGHILKEDLPENKMLVLVAAVKKELVSERLKLLKDLGFQVNVMEVDSVALINAFNFNYSQDSNLKNKTIALLNIGASQSNLNILEDGIPRLSRDIRIAGNSFTQKIADVLSLDLKAAEELKLNPPAEKLESVNNIMQSILSNLGSELRTSFDYYESQSVASVEKIFLSGGGSLFMGLIGMLSALMGIPVEYWDPLREIKLSAGVDAAKVKPLSSQLAVAIGLALRP